MEVSLELYDREDLPVMSKDELLEHVDVLQSLIDDIRPEDCRNCGRKFLSVEGSQYCDRDCEMGWRKFVPFELRHKGVA